MIARRREWLGGGLVALLGLGVMLEARAYGLGTLARTGPGFFPTAIGAMLALIGVLIALSGPDPAHDPNRSVDWRGWGCILSGVLAFILLGEPFGLGPATFACVFIAAWGDRRAAWRGALGLAAGATLVAAVVFSWALKFQLPFWRG